MPVALFGFTIYTHHTAKRTERDTTFGVALMCTIRTSPILRGDGTFDAVQLVFTNAIGESVFDPVTHAEDDATIKKDRIVASGYKWSNITKLGTFGIESTPGAKAIREAINAKVRPSIVLVFTIRGYRFARSGAEVYLYDDAPDWRTPKDGSGDGVEDRSVGPSRVNFLRGRAGQRA